jgi:hypothetical protein
MHAEMVEDIVVHGAEVSPHIAARTVRYITLTLPGFRSRPAMLLGTVGEVALLAFSSTTSPSCRPPHASPLDPWAKRLAERPAGLGALSPAWATMSCRTCDIEHGFFSASPT